VPPGADVKLEHLHKVSASVSGVAVLNAEVDNVSTTTKSFQAGTRSRLVVSAGRRQQLRPA
jgi:hypothetical protein